MAVVDELIQILSTTLHLDEALVATLNESSPLLGGIPEFDSIAVATVVAALEERFGFVLEEDEIQAEAFESVGSLNRLVEEKLSARG